MTPSTGKQLSMRRLADPAGRFKMTAVDQRPPIKEPIAKHLGVEEAPWEEVARFKTLLIETLQEASTALLLDPHYAIPHGLPSLSPHKGLVVTLEDSIFQDAGNGRRSSQISDWTVGKIKRMGGDAVKVLAWYRPDADPAINRHQQEFTKRIGAACARYDIPFLFELLVYPLAAEAHQTQDYVEMRGKRADHVLGSVEEFAHPDYGVDIFKLESPVAATDIPDGAPDGGIQQLFDEMGRLAGRPWVMLSAGATKPAFRRVLDHAYAAGASGYLAGRAIWLEAFARYPDWAAMEADLRGTSRGYMDDLNALTDAKARPWHEHPVFGGAALRISPADATFREAYADL